MTASVFKGGWFELNGLPWVFSVLVHLAFGILLTVSLAIAPHGPRPAPGTGKVSEPVKATVVDQKLIDQQLAALKAADSRKKAAEEARQKKLRQEADAARKTREHEQKRIAELRAQHAAQEKADQQRLAKLKQETDVQQAAVASAEAKRKAEEARLAKIKKQQEEVAAKRKAAQEAKQQAEREAQLKAQLATEQKARDERLAKLRGSYVEAIRQKVERNWIKPPTAQAGLDCTVRVEQIPGGEVVDVKVTQCNGDDVVQRSIIAAVNKASPLPAPSDPALFDRVIVFNFKPSE